VIPGGDGELYLKLVLGNLLELCEIQKKPIELTKRKNCYGINIDGQHCGNNHLAMPAASNRRGQL
jgi:hypothetical protein